MHKRLRAIGLRLVVATASTLIGMLIAEGIIRVVTPQAVAFPWQDEVNGITAPRPGARGRHAIPNTFDVTVTFNSQRFRDRKDFRPEPEPESLRLAILGDSFTFGYGANDDETYPAQLERILQENLSEKRDVKAKGVEVINAGNGGTGTGEQALWYDIWVKNFRPQIVVLTVGPNDVDDDLARGLFFLDESGEASPRPLENLRNADESLRSTRWFLNGIPGYSFLAQHSQLLALLRNTGSAIIKNRRKGAFTNSSNVSAEAGAKNRFVQEGIPMLAAEIEWLNARVRGAGAHLGVVFVPRSESVYESQVSWANEARWKSEIIVNALKEVCSKNAIPFSDLVPLVREEAKHTSQPLYYDGLDYHPNPNGYKAIAEAVAEFLIRSGVT